MANSYLIIMQITNLISESFLSLTGFLTYYFLIRKIPQKQVLLWGTFILSVAMTAFFSALYFAGVSGMDNWHDFFKNIGSSTGIILLVAGIYSLIFKETFSSKPTFWIVALSLGFALICMFLNLNQVFVLMPLIGILCVLIFGIIALKKGYKQAGIYLLLATLFSILANTFNLLELSINPISAYCFFLACVLVCFGMAAKSMNHSIS